MSVDVSQDVSVNVNVSVYVNFDVRIDVEFSCSGRHVPRKRRLLQGEFSGCESRDFEFLLSWQR